MSDPLAEVVAIALDAIWVALEQLHTKARLAVYLNGSDPLGVDLLADVKIIEGLAQQAIRALETRG